jgi:WD40 repeat protein
MGAPQEIMKQYTVGRIIMKFAPDNRTIAAGLTDGSIEVWDVHTGIRKGNILWKGEFIVSPRWIDELVFSSDVQLLVSASSEGRSACVTIWDLITKTVRLKVNCVKGAAMKIGIALSPDDKLLAIPRRKGVVEVWDIATKTIMFSFDELGGWVGRMSFSPDGVLLALAFEDKMIQVWNMETRKLEWVLEGGTDWATKLIFSQDNQRIVSIAWDNTIRVWKLPAMSTMEDGYPTRAVSR